MAQHLIILDSGCSWHAPEAIWGLAALTAWVFADQDRLRPSCSCRQPCFQLP